MTPLEITLFLSGDVMTGRGIDQILPHPCAPRIHEPYIQDALDYVKLAAERHSPIPRSVEPTYIWGDALAEFEHKQPDAKIINLETAITLSEEWVPKGINYRMHPLNVSCLTAAKIDCCVLANNHILDWGYEGLTETLDTLHQANIKTAGAGEVLAEAGAPAILQIPHKSRVLVFSFGMESSGIPIEWAAGDENAGVNFLRDLSYSTVQQVKQQIQKAKRSGDLALASVHWGSNWGYETSNEEIQFTHRLIEEAGVDLIHGHSSHHPKAIEVYRGKLVLYGCGDLINDYEGIRGYEEFRGDLSLMYFVTLNLESGQLVRLEMTPTQMRRFQIRRASFADTRWLQKALTREGKRFGSKVIQDENHRLSLLGP